MIKQSKMARAVSRVDSDFMPFTFGLDLVTPSNETEPGSLRECKNIERDINGGYIYGKGYERIDGQARPSDALYSKLDVTITGSISLGDTVTDTTTAGTGVVVAVNTTYDATQHFIIVTKVSGTLGHDSVVHTLNVSGSPEATTDGLAGVGSAPTTKLNAQYKNLAADEYRSDITAITGDGDVLGAEVLNDVLYAFRNHTDNLSAKMWKTSVSGWVEVALGREMAFTSGGTVEISDGDTVTGKTSGATAVVTRSVLQSGSWSGGTAVGRLIFASQTGTFQAAEALSIGGGGGSDDAIATADGTAITLQPNGSYEFDVYHFGGEANTNRIYGVDGVNRGFEFDGTVFVPIITGMTADAPTHVVVHNNHLFYSFEGSAQHSGIGTPYIWSPIFGAAELAVGDTVTAFEIQPGDKAKASLAIMSRNRIHILYGASSSDWDLVRYRREVGAFVGSVQEFGLTFMMDDRGIISLETVQAHGNFNHNLVSRLVQPFITSHKGTVSASCIARDKSQYRVFFNDGSALYITTDNREVVGIMQQLLSHPVKCITSVELSSGAEAIYFGSDNGFVYQMEKGTSFDGDAIDRVFSTHFNHSKSRRVEKSYSEASFEISGEGYAEFQFRYELGYNDVNISQPSQANVALNFSSANWDSFTWDEFVWDGVILSPSNISLDGDAENISMIFTSSSDYFDPLLFTGAQMLIAGRHQLRS